MDEVERQIERLAHPDSRIRRDAAWLLGMSGDPRAVDALLVAAGERSPGALAALEALGRIGDARAVSFLMDVLRAREQVVRIAAATVLTSIGGRQEAARIERGDLRPLKRLMRLVRLDEQGVRIALASAAPTVGDDRTAALVDLLTGSRLSPATPWVSAASALGGIAWRQPVLRLREALPLLSTLALCAVQDDERRVYREAIRRIERATAPLKNLPLPSCAPPPSPESLPVPAVASAPDADGLPLASVHRPPAGPNTTGATVPRRLRSLARALPWGRRHG